MRTAILGLAAFFLAAALTTLVGLKLQGHGAPPAESPAGTPAELGSDRAAEPDRSASSDHPPSAAGPLPTEATQQPAALRADSLAPAPPEPVPPAGALFSAPLPGPATQGAGAEHLAKILAAMQPAKAAELLGAMSGEAAGELLSHLTPRQAAAVLGAMPNERAAALGRRLLQPKGQQR